MRSWIRNPLAIFAENSSGGVVVEDSIIIECIGAGQRPSLSCDQIFDASEHVVLPGLINTHHHFYQTLTRAHPQALNKELFDWLKALYPIWAQITPSQLEIATRAALAELLLSGCTTAADHQYLFPTGLEFALDIQHQVAKELGMRVTLTRGSMNLSKKDGGLPPDSVVQDLDTILSDSERVIAQYHDDSPGSYCQIALAPCSPFSVTEELMRGSVELAAKYKVRLHTHLAETEDENHFCHARYKCRPLDYLEELGWVNENVWLAHGIHFSPHISQIKMLLIMIIIVT